MYVTLVCVVFSSFAANPQQASATIPKIVNFQGKLTKTSDGTNVANGSYAFEFKLYDALTSGSLLWTETFDQASGDCAKLVVTNAVFNAKLGSCNALTGVDFTTGSLYLSVNFAPTGTSYDGEMSPRKQFVAAPFAFVANSLNGDGNIDLADFDVDSDGKTTIAPDTAGDSLTISNSATADIQGIVISSSGSTQTAGTIQVTSNTITDTAVLGMALTGTVQDAAAGLTVYGNKTTVTVDTDAGQSHTVYGDHITIANNDASSTAYGLYVDAGTGAGTEYAAAFMNGSVGIGIATPTKALTVEGAMNFTSSGTVRGIVGPPTWDNSYISFQNGTLAESAANSALNQSSGGVTILNAASGQPIYLRTGNSDRVTVNATGLGIGDTSPAAALTVGSGDLFQVNSSGAIAAATGITSSGTINFSGLSASGIVYTDGSKNLTSTAPTSGALGYWSRTGTTLQPTTSNDVISISGNSGDIATLASSATGSANKTLNVSQTGATSGTDYAGYFSNTGAATTNVGLYATATGATNNYAAIFENGNVGVGATSPTGKLAITETTTAQPAISISHGTNSDVISITKGAGVGNLINASFTSGQSNGISFTNTDASTTFANSSMRGLTATLSSGFDNYDITAGRFSATQTRNTAGTNGGTPYGIYSTASTTASAPVGYAGFFESGSARVIPVVAKGNGSQTSDLFQAQNSSGTVLFDISSGGNVGINNTSPDAKLDVVNATIANGKALAKFTGTTTTSTASGTAYGLYNSFANANTTNADTAYSIYNTVTDATALANTVYGNYSDIALSGNAAKTGIGQYLNISTSSTTADTAVGIDIASTATGIITSGTRNVYGARLQPTAGAESTGGTTNVYGAYVKPSADVGAGGTVNGYGLYIANGTYDTDGTSTNTGLYVESPTGADTNYAAIFAGGNVGIGTTAPTALLDVYNSGDSIFAVDNTSDGQVRIKATGAHSQAITLTPRLVSATLFPTGGAGIAIQSSSEFAISAATGGLSLSGGGTTSDLRITTGGNVGIGDNSPASALTVGSGDLFQVNSSGAIAAVVGITNTGVTTTTVSSATALTVAKAGTNYALQVDTVTASAATGLKITSAAAAGGVALAAISSGTNENITIDAKGSGTVSIGASSTGDVLLGGGSGSTGCTVTNSTGAFACTAGGSFTTLGLTGAVTGATSYNGLVITANTGVITSGTWNGTALTDAYVSDTLTASLFTGSGSTTTAVDLGTAEVAGTLAVGNGGTGATSLTDLITLGTHTTGNYVTSITNGSGISGGNGGSEGAALTLALGALSADWSQTGAFDITLNNAASELKILESAGGAFYGIFDVTDLSADRTMTVPDASGTLITTGNLSSITTVGTISSGTWNGTAISSTYGGTGINTSGSTGVPYITGGTWSVDATALAANHGGTGQSSYTTGDILYASSSSALSKLAGVATGSVLVSGGVGVAPAWSTAITVTTSVTSATINATSALQLGGASINTAGTLSNVAYKNAANTFTANNIFQPTVTNGTGASAGVQIAANSLTSGNGVDISSTSLSTGNLTAISSSSTAGGISGSSTLLNLARTGANGSTGHTAYGLYSTVTNTNVTSGTNVAAYLSASGATTANYGLLVAAGNVGIGTTTPPAKLTIEDGGSDSSNYGAIQIVKAATGHTGSHISFIRAASSVVGLGYKQTSNIFGFGAGTTGAFDPTYLAIDTTTGNITVGSSAAATAGLDLVSTVTTGTAQKITTSSLTTGAGLNIVGPTSTGITGTGILRVTSDVGASGTGGYLAGFNPDYSSGTAASSYGIVISGTDSTNVANSNNNFYSGITLSGNAAKNAYAGYFTVSSSSTTADTTTAGLFNSSITGAISTGTRQVWGIYSGPSTSGANTGGTTQVFGGYFAPSSTGSTTGSTVNVYGNYIANAATLTTGGTINSYGIYIANGSMNTTGTSTQYGLYVDTQSGADTNYGAYIGGFVGIGTSAPVSQLHVVANTASNTSGLRLDSNSSNGTNLQLYNNNSTGVSKFIRVMSDSSLQVINSAYSAALLTLTDGGNMGIGMSPTYKLDVSGDIRTSGTFRGTCNVDPAFSDFDCADYAEIYDSVAPVAAGEVLAVSSVGGESRKI